MKGKSPALPGFAVTIPYTQMQQQGDLFAMELFYNNVDAAITEYFGQIAPLISE
jgi:hypothetical protein